MEGAMAASSSAFAGNERQDLTNTTHLHREEFAPALVSRFRALMDLIRTTVAANNALHLPTNSVGSITAATPREAFPFETDVSLIQAFMAWLRGALDGEVLEAVVITRIQNGEHYTARYIRSAYLRGLENATERLREKGYAVDQAVVDQAFNMPVHQRTLRLLYTRTYENLEGITDDTAAAIREELTQAFAEGLGPQKTAARLNDRVDKIGITRARTLSRTELSNAANTASANRYQRMGVEQVDILTSDPCEVCETLAENGPYPVSEAASLIPGQTHPNCVCSIAPHIDISLTGPEYNDSQTDVTYSLELR